MNYEDNHDDWLACYYLRRTLRKLGLSFPISQRESFEDLMHSIQELEPDGWANKNG